MKKPVTPDEEWLGDVSTVIAGSQYYDADTESGGKLNLEREPNNPHDENAVRIENEDFEKIGYLPRRIVSWLAPLIDDGRVMVDAEIEPSERSYDDDLPPLRLKLFLSHKGAGILDLSSDPKNELEGVHRAVLETFMAAESWTRQGVVAGTGRRLEALFKKDLLPETKMLLLLFPHRAEMTAKRKAGIALDATRDFMASLEMGQAIVHGNLSLFPIYSHNNGNASYDLLNVALEAGDAEVTEMSESGVVSELQVVNNGTRRILIPEGELLTGAKQDRMVNISVLVAAATTFTLPVSCVEEGRWSSVSHGFQATHYAPHSLRASKNVSVRADRESGGRGNSDQGSVWRDIDETMRSMEIESDTHSLPESLEKAGKRLVEYKNNILMPAGCCGVILGISGRICGMDYFDHADVFARMWPQISESYFFEAARHAADEAITADAQACAYLEEVREALEVSSGTLGEGTELYVKGDQVTGSAIWDEGRLCHLTASTL